MELFRQARGRRQNGRLPVLLQIALLQDDNNEPEDASEAETPVGVQRSAESARLIAGTIVST